MEPNSSFECVDNWHPSPALATATIDLYRIGKIAISAVRQGFIFLWLALLPFILPTQLQADEGDEVTKLWCQWMKKKILQQFVDGLSHYNLVYPAIYSVSWLPLVTNSSWSFITT